MVDAAAAESTGWELQGGCGAEAEETRVDLDLHRISRTTKYSFNN